MHILKDLWKGFVCLHHPHEYKVKIGNIFASSAAGFVAGVIVASLMWFAAYTIKNSF